MNKTIFALFLSTVGLMAQDIVPGSTVFTRGFLRVTNQSSAQTYLGISGGIITTSQLSNAILRTNGIGYGTTLTNFVYVGNSNGASWSGNLFSAQKIALGVDLFQMSNSKLYVDGGSIVFPDTQGIVWMHGDYIRDRNNAHATDGSGSLLEIYGAHGIGLFGDDNIQVGNSTANNANMSMQYNDSEFFDAFPSGYIPRSKTFGFATRVGAAFMQGVGANTNYFGNATELWFFSGQPPTIGAPTVSGTFNGYNYNRAMRMLTNGFEVNGPLRITDLAYANTLSLTNSSGYLYVDSPNGLVVAASTSSSNFFGGINVMATNAGPIFSITNAIVLGTRYSNSAQRAFITASFTLNGAAAGTAIVTLYVEGNVTNKLKISSGPLASLTVVDTLSAMVGPNEVYYFADESSGSGASVAFVANTFTRKLW